MSNLYNLLIPVWFSISDYYVYGCGTSDEVYNSYGKIDLFSHPKQWLGISSPSFVFLYYDYCGPNATTIILMLFKNGKSSKKNG